MLTKVSQIDTIQAVLVLLFLSHLNCRGSSVVERKPEELSVVGSIPTPGTKKISFFYLNLSFFSYNMI